MTSWEIARQNQNLANIQDKLPRSVAQVEIAKQQGVQFFDITNEQFALLVGYVTTLIGCQLPSPEGTILLINYCREQFPFVTDREFKLACELNAAGKFDIIVQHYNSLDASFMGAILSRYKAYENSSNQQRAKIENNATRPIEKPKPITEKTAREIIAKDLESLRQRKSMTPAMLVAPVVMDWIMENEDCAWMTDDKIKAWYNEAWARVREEMQYSRTALQKWKEDKRPEWTDFVQKVLTERKRIAYVEYLKRRL